MPSVESHGTQVPLRYVGIGASAGGLQALEELFDHMLPDTGMSFIVIQHLSPEFESQMDHLLARHTSMPVELIRDGHGRQPPTPFMFFPPAKRRSFPATGCY